MKEVVKITVVLAFFISGPFLCVIDSVGAAPAPNEKIVEAARKWLSGTEAERAALESKLEKFTEGIDGVMNELMPHGSDEHKDIKGKEIKGDTFTVPELLARNEDHPFNFYVPSHYNPTKKMGLILWMHGGGTYKPGKNIKRRSILNKIKKFEAGDYIAVAAEACHGVNFPKGAVMDKMAGRWSVPETERYLSDLTNEFMHRYNIDPNRVLLWGYSMGGVGAYNQAMRTDRFAMVGIGAGSWTFGTFDTMLNTPTFIWHGNKDSYWNSKEDCRNRMTDVSHSRIAHDILTDLKYEHSYIETDGGHNKVNVIKGKSVYIIDTYLFDGKSGYAIGKTRDPYAKRVIAMTPRGSYENHDPRTSGDPYDQAESRHDRWVSIEKYRPGPISVDFINKKGKIQKAESREEWLDYSATRGRSIFRGARIDVENLGDNNFEATTKHVDSYSLWLHPKMVDFSRPIKVKTNGKIAEYRCKPSLLTSLESFERKEDWGLIYPGKIMIGVTGKGK